MPKSHLAPERPTAAERDASASLSIIRNPLPPPAARAFVVLAVVTDDGTIIAEFPPNPMGRDASKLYAEQCGGWVATVKTSRPAQWEKNPPVPAARRKPEPPASVRVYVTGQPARVIPCDNRQDAITLANRIAETANQQNGGILTRNGDTLTVEWKYLPGGVDGTGRRFAERPAGFLTVTVCERQ